MRSMRSRLEDVERKVEAIKPPQQLRHFYVDGNDPNVDVEDFLRECDHDMDAPGYRNIVRIIVSAKDGKPVYEPYRDITAEMRAKGCK